MKKITSFMLLILSGISRVCGPRSGGLSKVWLTDKGNISSMTRSVTGEYTSITMVGASVFQPFEFEIDTAERINDATLTNLNGQVAHSVEMYFGKQTQTTRNAFQAIIDSSVCGIVAICLDNNGTMWIEGWSENFKGDRALRLKTGSAKSGKVFTDINGTTVMLESVDNEYANEFTGTIPV